MTKKILLIALLIFTSVSAKEAINNTNPFLHDDHFPGGYFLMADALPHFMGVYMKHGGMHKIKPTKEQEEVLEKQFDKMVKIIMSTATQIKELETKLVSNVVNNGKTAEDVSDTLDKIGMMRKDLTILQIECLNIFKKTLSKEQYRMMTDLAIEESKKR